MENLMKTADHALERLINSGASKGQCIVRMTNTSELDSESGEFAMLRNVDNKTDIKLTAFVGNKVGTGSTGSGESAAVEACAKESVELARSARGDDARGMNESGERIELAAQGGGVDVDTLIQRTGEFLSYVEKNHPTINIRRATIRHTGGVEIYKNTAGTTIIHPISNYRMNAMVIARVGDKMSSFSSVGFAAKELTKPFSEMGLVAEILKNCEKQVDTSGFGEKKVGTVILAPQCLGGFMGSMIDAFMSGPSLVAGVSRWRNAVGTMVADPSFSLTAAPRDPRIAGADGFTSDGFVAENQPIIENGKLVSLLPDLYTANKTGLARGLNGGEGGYIIEGGDKTLDELIAGIENGILMYRFSGGNPQASGDFSGIAKNSFIIKNGKITAAAKETTVSGNLADMLTNIRGMTRQTVEGGSYVLPYAAFDGITIR